MIDDINMLLKGDRARFANELRGWIEVVGGRITSHGYSGRGHIGGTTVRLGRLGMRFPAVAFPEIRPTPEVSETAVRFVQTAGGRPPVPSPRHVRGRPYVQITGPTVWSTLALTIRADGSHDHEVLGASSFPRHWIYDHRGKLVEKAAVIDFDT